MNLTIAGRLVANDVRAIPGLSASEDARWAAMTNFEVVTWVRGSVSHDGVDEEVTDRRLRKAYHQVLNATDSQIERALT